MKKLYNFAMFITIAASLNLGMGRVVFGQNQPQGIPAPAPSSNSKELEGEIAEVTGYIRSAEQELEQIKARIGQLKFDKQRITQKITNLEEYIAQYKKQIENYSRSLAICREQENDLQNTRAQETDRYVSAQSRLIEQCFSRARARIPRFLYTQDIQKETEQLVSDLREDIRLANSEGKILDIEKDTLESEINGFNFRLEDLNSRVKELLQSQ